MAGPIEKDALPNKWVHSHEEDSGDEMVFRPASFAFPPSRGRKSFELAPDGSLVSLGIGADDRPTSAAGSWRLQGDNALELTPAAGGAGKSVMQLVSVAPDRLVVKK
jgi:hypothetical protein